MQSLARSIGRALVSVQLQYYMSYLVIHKIMLGYKFVNRDVHADRAQVSSICAYPFTSLSVVTQHTVRSHSIFTMVWQSVK